MEFCLDFFIVVDRLVEVDEELDEVVVDFMGEQSEKVVFVVCSECKRQKRNEPCRP